MRAAKNVAGLRDGEHRKDAAIVLFEARREGWVRDARRALLDALLANGRATADDVRERVELPKGLNPKAFGAVPAVLARAGIIRRTGFVRSCRPVAHARPISVWQLVDPEAAERWLASHQPLSPLKAADELLKNEAPAGATVEASVQSNLPGFDDRKEPNTHG